MLARALGFSVLLLAFLTAVSIADAAPAAPAELVTACAAMWTNQPLEGYLGVTGPDGQLRAWTDPVPAGGVSVWVCASRPAYAWLWRVQGDQTPVELWPLGTNVVALEPGVPVMVPQAGPIGAADARSLLLALSATSTRPAPIKGFSWMAPGAGSVVKLTLPGWPAQVLWEPIPLGPATPVETTPTEKPK